MNKPITVVIPNFNGAGLLKKNLPSVLSAVESYGNNSSVTVVDDGSADESLDVLKQHFSIVNVVKHENNMGFAEAVHTGVRSAKTELVFILNSDVQLSHDFFPPLVSYFDDDKTFSVNPAIYDEKGVIKRHSWNYRQLRKGRIALLNWRLEEAVDITQSGGRCPTMYGHGGSMLVRKQMFDALKGFDPIFKPYYGEDSDIGIRAWRRGWYSYFEPGASLVHQSIGSIKANVELKKVKTIRRRNRYLLEWIHLTPIQLATKTIPFSIFQLLGELITFDFVNLKGFGLALLKLPEVLVSRKAIKQTSKKEINEVFDILAQKSTRI